VGVDRTDVETWVEGYEWAWRTAGTDAVTALFTADATYSPSPWADPVVGHEALRAFWEAERDGPDEGFTLTSEVVAVDGRVAVVRVAVDYDDGARWRDLWILTLDPTGRCATFEEWPFSPTQPDGHD
jgi:hypothetical protein